MVQISNQLQWWVCLIFLLGYQWARCATLDDLFPPPTKTVATLKPLVQGQQVYSYQRLLADTAHLEETYPGLIEVSDIGESVFGRRIIAIRLGRGPVAITLNGSHHGREWITSSVLMAMIDRYVLAYYRGEILDGYDVYDLLNRVSLHIVPMVNPDGVSLAQSGAASAPNRVRVLALNGGSANFCGWKANGRGVDLNRQYPANWETIERQAPWPGPWNYRGAAPLTEPEAQAMAAFTRRHRFALHAALHSSGEVIYWHFYQRGELFSRTARIAHHIQTLTGYRRIPPRSYESGGGYKDWVVQTYGVPAFTVEVGRYTGEKAVPLAQYPRIWGQVRALGLLLAREAVEPSRSPHMLCGTLDGRGVITGDNPETIKAALTRLVWEGEGLSAALTRVGHKSVWRYPTSHCYRVVVDGRTVSVHADAVAAGAALAQALAELKAAGGYVVTNMRVLAATQGDGIAHELTLDPQGTARCDEVEITLPAPPAERDNRLTVPATFFTAMGASAATNAKEHTVTLARGDTRLILVPGSALALRGETPLRLDAAVYRERGITMVPLRSVAQALGGCVTVDAATCVINIRWYTAAALAPVQEPDPPPPPA